MGLGHKTDQLIPVQNHYFNDMKVTKVVAGNHHTLLLSADGNVYAFGFNDYAQLGTGGFDKHGTPYNPLMKHGPFVDIVAQKFNNISAAVTANGGHFVWGKCRKPLGALLSPTVVTGVDYIHDIIGFLMNEEFVHNIHSFIIYGETGSDVIVVTKDDVVFHMNVNNITQMTELCELSAKDVIKISAGYKYLCALTSEGEVYTWIDNQTDPVQDVAYAADNYIIMLGDSDPSPHPIKLSLDLNNENIVDIECGLHHTLALTDAGRVYAWGQLGNGNTINQYKPIKVVGGLTGCRVISIACGGNHSLAVTDTGSVFGWGLNGNGQLGLGHTIKQSLPVRIQYFNDMKVTKVAAGKCHTMFLSNEDIVSHIDSTISAAVTANGVLYVWGECRQPFGDLLTPTAINLSNDHPVLNSMCEAFDNTISSNFQFVINGQSIHVIKEYLIIRCKRMEPMMRLLNTNQTEVVITDYSYEAFKAFLRYLYTNDVFVAPDIAVELLGLADTYAETDLKRKCTRLLRNNITVENVSLIYESALKHSVLELHEICFNYAVKHFEEVSKTKAFNDLDINIRIQFLCKLTANARLLNNNCKH
ncbi:unnamed protein product [Medioppia subpectinata]|uniref:BTB domain-containing protein n=1 Tax=Medioppia subpectinata TaxID=1979941 RepID=A0A7R9Q089_9ACAR|nr:unnamed protein product [Medioppia subpectinata]CAG2106992.1 unnamed protein product [Medioppia subpectinata]